MFEENKFNIEELKVNKNKYFHIGIPGLTKELENNREIWKIMLDKWLRVC